jgi:invasion protein IalB
MGHRGTSRHVSAGLKFIWPVLALLIFSGDAGLWWHVRRSEDQSNPSGFLLADLNRWTVHCWERQLHGNACWVTLSFPLRTADGQEEYAIVGFSSSYSVLFAPIQKFTIASLRVDNHPFTEMPSVDGNGAVLWQRPNSLLHSVLTGKLLTVRFIDSETGLSVEHRVSLAGFAEAYTRYQESMTPSLAAGRIGPNEPAMR